MISMLYLQMSFDLNIKLLTVVYIFQLLTNFKNYKNKKNQKYWT